MVNTSVAPKRKVICLGTIVADLIGGPLATIPERAGLVIVDEMKLFPGGGAVNTATALSRFGVPVSVVGQVGSDQLGNYILDKLNEEGVDTSQVGLDLNLNTSATMVMVDGDGERRFIHHIGANGQLNSDHIENNIFRDSSILHIAYAFILPGLDGLPMVNLLKKAQENGLTTILDTTWDVHNRWLSLLEPCLPYTDYLVPNLNEGRALTGLSDPMDIASSLIDSGANNVILKLNRAGSMFMNKHKAHSIYPAFDITSVDSTGAGDAFDAGIITGLWHDWPIDKTMEFANAVGALCTSGHGAVGNIESLENSLDFMANHPQRRDQSLTLELERN